ncbi:hypothetical protein JCM6882_001987 [Rhodosporidiobolus microsporus]
MSLRGIRSNGMTLRAQEPAAADHAVYEFDIDYEHWHDRPTPTQGRSAWNGQAHGFPPSLTSDRRPWQIYLRFHNWESEHDKYLVIRASKRLPKRAPKKPEPEEDKDKQETDDAPALRSPGPPQPGVPTIFPRSSLPQMMYMEMDGTPLLPEAFKADDNDDLDCTHTTRNALLVHARLFAIKYRDRKVAETLHVETTVKQKDALRSASPGFELLELKIPRNKLDSIPFSPIAGSAGKEGRFLRLELTTIFNHDFARSLERPFSDVSYDTDLLLFRVGAHPLRKAPHDLRLFFPAVGPDGAELWASSSALRSVSPYFEDLFESGFAEAVTRHGKRRPRLPSPAGSVETSQPASAPSPGSSASNPAESAPLVTDDAQEMEGDVAPVPAIGASKEGGMASPAKLEASDFAPEDDEDSDDELDALVATRAPQLLRAPDSDAETEYHQVTIKGRTAWSTYRAVLTCAMSGRIEFSRLRSSYINERDRHKGMMDESDEDFVDCPRYCPMGVSPKSVFRLSHLLQMEELAEKALTEFRQRLTADNVLHELLSPTAAKYDELRKEAMTFATNNWDEVKRSSGFKEIKAKVANGEMPHAAPILMELLEAK